MKKFAALIATATLASAASVAMAQSTPGMTTQNNDNTMQVPAGQNWTPKDANTGQTTSQNMPMGDQSSQNYASTPASAPGQRYQPLQQVGNGIPSNTGTGDASTGGYGAPMYGSSQAGPGAATPLIGAPKN
ncbi:MAG: hypothetical protein ACRYG5_13000 [Janthinobacterium lividum]